MDNKSVTRDDINADGAVDEGDYQEMADILLSDSTSSTDYQPANTALDADTAKVDAGQSQSLTISVVNIEVKVTAMQFDVTLPKGISLISDAITGASGKGSSYAASNGTRIVIFSTQSTSLNSQGASLLNLPIQVDSTVAPGRYRIDFTNVVMSGIDFTSYSGANFFTYIDVEDPVGVKAAGASAGIRIKTVNNGVSLYSDVAADVAIYSASGLLIAKERIQSSESKYIYLLPGIYIINGVKTRIK